MDIEEKCNEENQNDTSLTQFLESGMNNINVNGLCIKGNYIPEELLSEIFCYIDYKQLLLCHLVCTRWNTVIKKYIWRIKAELMSGQMFPVDVNIPWTSYYFICGKKPFNRNLLVSDKVKVINEEAFNIIKFDENDNNPPINVLPFPEDAIFEGKFYCIATPIQYDEFTCTRKLVIDLLKEGFTEHILDNLQPTVKISEWYCCKEDITNAVYNGSIKLLNNKEDSNKIMRVFHFNKNLSNKRGTWFKFGHQFKKYGKGLRLIKFYDDGESEIFMAGASVTLEMPDFKENSNRRDV